MPDINLSLIDKINLEVPSVEIDDNDIDKVINNIRKQNSEWSDSTKEAADDNKIVVDYEGKINGKDFKNNKQSDFSFVINDTIKGDPATVSLFKEFSLKCIGKNVNDIVEVSNKMPNDFPDKELAGKTVVYCIKIKKILIGKLPALNKEFFSNLVYDP